MPRALRPRISRLSKRVEPWTLLASWEAKAYLRASRETELADEFPIHVVCEWIGNSPDVARKHSFTVTDDHFAKAAGHTAAGEKATQNPAQSVHAESRTDSHDESEPAAPLAIAGGAAVADYTKVPPRRVEFLQNPREIPRSRKIPDHIPDQLGWPPISTRWFDSSANCRTDSARPS